MARAMEVSSGLVEHAYTASNAGVLFREHSHTGVLFRSAPVLRVLAEEGCVGCIIVRHAKYDGVGCQHCEWEGGCRKESTGLREQTGPVYFITFAVLLSTTSTGTCE